MSALRASRLQRLLIKKPSASTLGYIIRILMIIKLAISVIQVFLP